MNIHAQLTATAATNKTKTKQMNGQNNRKIKCPNKLVFYLFLWKLLLFLLFNAIGDFIIDTMISCFFFLYSFVRSFVHGVFSLNYSMFVGWFAFNIEVVDCVQCRNVHMRRKVNAISVSDSKWL